MTDEHTPRQTNISDLLDIVLQVGAKISPDRKAVFLRTSQLEVFVERIKQEAVKDLEWQHHAKDITKWLHCMSYNDSYFGEPPGLVKQVTAELNRLMPPTPLKAANSP